MAKSKGKRKKNRRRKPEKKRPVPRARQRDRRYDFRIPESIALLPDISSDYRTNKPITKQRIWRLKIRDKATIRVSNKNAIKRSIDAIVGTESFHPNTTVRKVCKSRSKRREILFSRRKAGKGVSGPKKRKYTQKSKVRC